MNALAETHAGQDFVILGFPCNQFGLQEPGETPEEIMNGITHVRPGNGFVPKMTFFQKTKVNGAEEDPIFTFLKSSCSYTDSTFESSLFYEPLRVDDIRWNFEKFLVGRDGKPYARYHPNVVEPEELLGDIKALLNAV